jgi:hypothetical protein
METYEEFARVYTDAFAAYCAAPEYVSDNVGRVCTVIARKPNPERKRRRMVCADLMNAYPKWFGRLDRKMFGAS